jgi:4,5-DOPA dioxygenase extradiol
MARLPALFVSHGPPTLAVQDSPVRRFLAGYGAEIERPEAVLAVSAHWETEAPAASTAERPETIHDFFGFPPALYEMRYAAPGAPELARRAAALLGEAGLDAALDPGRGLDHGAWVPLALLYPEASVPVAQLSIQTSLGPAHHLRLGAALRPLREEGVLILGSGNLTHNLPRFRGQPPDAPAPAWVSAFTDWTAEAILEARTDDLLDYRGQAPYGAENHPSEDHLLPLFVALGAGSPGTPGRRLHASVLHAVLAMDAYAFD